MFTRYGVYFTAEGDLAARGAAWLGWNVAAGVGVAHPDVGVDLAEVTATPRKYGFHGTMKPPFRLAEGRDEAGLREAFGALCAGVRPAICAGLEVARLGRFLALVPQGDASDLKALAAKVVRDLDEFRAAPSAAELEKRRGRGLSEAQEENLRLWGYPHVMDQFRFHMTLTGRMKDLTEVQHAAETYFDPVLPRPFRLDTMTLVGERADGMFCEIERRPLGR